MNKREYEENLKQRQEKHLQNIGKREDDYWQPCLHEHCPECIGTGIRKDGKLCIHSISCSCPKCSPRCSS